MSLRACDCHVEQGHSRPRATVVTLGDQVCRQTTTGDLRRADSHPEPDAFLARSPVAMLILWVPSSSEILALMSSLAKPAITGFCCLHQPTLGRHHCPLPPKHLNLSFPALTSPEPLVSWLLSSSKEGWPPPPWGLFPAVGGETASSLIQASSRGFCRARGPHSRLRFPWPRPCLPQRPLPGNI